MQRPAPTRRFVAGSRTVSDAAAAYLRHLHRRPARWVLYAGYAAFYAALVVVAGALTGLGTTVLVVIWVAAMVAAVLAVNAWAYRGLQKLGRSSLAPGATYESTWDDQGFWVSGPMGEGRLSWSAATSADTVGEWVFLEQTNVAMAMIYPRSLLPDDVADRVGAARPSEPRTHDSP